MRGGFGNYLKAPDRGLLSFLNNLNKKRRHIWVSNTSSISSGTIISQIRLYQTDRI